MKNRPKAVSKGHGQEKRIGSWRQAACLGCLFLAAIVFIVMQSMHRSLYEATLEDEERYLSGDPVEAAMRWESRRFRDNMVKLTTGDEGGEVPVKTRGPDSDVASESAESVATEEKNVKYRNPREPELFRAMYSLGLDPKRTPINARIATALRMLGINPVSGGQSVHWKELLVGDHSVEVARQFVNCSDTNCTPTLKRTKFDLSNFQEVGVDGPFALEPNLGQDGLVEMREGWEKRRASVAADMAALGMQQPWGNSCFMWLKDCYDLATNPSVLSVVKEALGQSVILYSMAIESAKGGSIQLLHTDAEPAECTATATVVIGTPVRFLSSSHYASYKSSMMNTLRVQILRGKAFLQNSDHSRNWMEQVLKGLVSDSESVKSRHADYRTVNVDAGSFVVFPGHMWHASVNPDSTPRTSIVLQYARSECNIREPVGFMGVAAQRIPLFSAITPPAVILTEGPILSPEYVNDIRKWSAFQTDDSTVTSRVLSELMPSGSAENVTWTTTEIRTASNNLINKTVSVTSLESGEIVSNGGDTVRRVLQVSTAIFAGFTIEAFTKNRHGKGVVVCPMHKHDEEELLLVLEGKLKIVRSGEGPLSWMREMSELTMGGEAFFPSKSPHAIVSMSERLSFLLLRWRPRRPKGKEAQAAMAASQARARLHHPPHQFLERKTLEHGKLKLRPLDGLEGLHSFSVRLAAGQGYDPGNQYGYDVVEICMLGAIEILPEAQRLGRYSIALVPAYTPHLLWNTARFPTFVAVVEFHHLRPLPNRTQFDDDFDAASFGAESKIMRR